jgi:hypothetical protein
VVFRIEDTASDQRWPEFASAAHAAGIGSTLSLPLDVGGAALGALNLYSRRVGSFDDEALALVFSAHGRGMPG